MAARRKSPPSDPATSGDEALRARRAADDAQMLAGSAGPVGSDEADGVMHDPRSPEADGPPTVGKTSGRGAKAERPSPLSERRQAKLPASEVSRRAKPPAETPKSLGAPSRPRAAAR